jgi:hypothetical protein
MDGGQRADSTRVSTASFPRGYRERTFCDVEATVGAGVAWRGYLLGALLSGVVTVFALPLGAARGVQGPAVGCAHTVRI